MKKDKKEKGMQVNVWDVIVLVCIAFLFGIFFLTDYSFGKWTAQIAIMSSFISYLTRDSFKALLLIPFTAIVVIPTIFFPPQYVTAPGNITLHKSCIDYMQGIVDENRQSPDNDRDTFSLDCELSGNGDDSDPTKIPKLKGLTDIAPSFNSQYEKTCEIDKNATKFTLFHAGLVQKSVRAYRFNIPGSASFVCTVLEEDKKNPYMDCPFQERFLEVFRSLSFGEFTLSIQVSTIEEDEPVDFQFDCNKT